MSDRDEGMTASPETERVAAWNDGPQTGALGKLLRDARAERGLELADVAELTHVRSEYLRALEEGRYEDLPEDVYTRNFVRLFAQATGLDVDSTLETYTRERRSAVGMTTLEESLDRDRRGVAPPPMPRGPRTGLGTLLPTVLLVLIVVLLALWGYNSLFDRPAGKVASSEAGNPTAAVTPQNAPAPGAASAGSLDAPTAGSLDAPAGTVGNSVEDRTVRVTIASEPAGAKVSIDGYALPGVTPITDAPVTAREGRVVSVTLDGFQPIEQTVDLRTDQALDYRLVPIQAASTASTSDTAQAAAAVGAGKIGINITEASWLEVYQSTERNSGTRLVYTTAEPGTHYTFDLPVFIHVGNAAGVHIILDGQDRGPLGSAGAVLSRAFPKP